MTLSTEEVETLEGMGYRQNMTTGSWIKLGPDGVPRSIICSFSLGVWTGSLPNNVTCKFRDPVSAAVWLGLMDSTP